MSSFLEKFSEISQIEYIKCTELEQNKRYDIITLENVTAKYGESLMATILNPNKMSTMFKVYLPKRYAGKFTDTELTNIKPNTMKLIYRGQKGNTVDIEIIQ
jgi:hypothetical protein